MSRFVATALLSTLLATFAWAAAASAAVEEKNGVDHLFNATLSLSGDCTTSTADPVPDPGCSDPEPVHPPEGKIVFPTGVTTDSYGDIYVVNKNESLGGEQVFHVDIFDPSGHYLTEVTQREAQSLAVDTAGRLYIGCQGERAGPTVVRYDPTAFNPAAGEIAYGASPVIVRERTSGPPPSIAVDPTNDHLYLRFQVDPGVSEYAAPVGIAPNQLITSAIGAGVLKTVNFAGIQIAIDAARHRLYATDYSGPESGPSRKELVRAFDTRPPYEEVGSLDGSTTPAEKFQTQAWRLALAVDEANGHVFVADTVTARRIYEFDEDGEYVETIKEPVFQWDIVAFAVDNSPQSPNQGFLFVPNGSSVSSPGHLYAFEPRPPAEPPRVESVWVSGVNAGEAVLHAEIDPRGFATHYAFEYVTREAFEEAGFAGAQLAGEGTTAASGEAVGVSAPATGLQPGTAYRFRARAESECQPGGCTGELDGGFSTFPAYAQTGECPNQALRTGSSAPLPDCRAYELVTPADTGGLAPWAPEHTVTGDFFETPPASPEGDSVAFIVRGGLIPGLEGTGSFEGDAYRSQREPDGWRTEGMSPSGTQASRVELGGLSPDHGFFAANLLEQGSLVIPGTQSTGYIRYPDGSFHLTGQGSIGVEPHVDVKYIAPGGSHILFSNRPFGSTAQRLEPDSPPEGVQAIYDRTPDGVTHVVSLLPGEVTPEADAGYEGVSADGSSVAFVLEGSLYLRVDDAETLPVAPAGATFAGLSDDGRYLFYVLGGDIYRFDSQGEETTRVTETGDARPILVPGGGHAVYFLSQGVLGEGPNPNGAEPVSGGENVYYWDGASTRFVATVTEPDVKGPFAALGGVFVGGFDEWMLAIGGGGPGGQLGRNPARATAGGSTLLFVSRADLAGFEAGGKAEIYRYDANGDALSCLSCAPPNERPSGDATLVDFNIFESGRPLDGHSLVPNLSADGRRAFFETPERLVPADNDNVSDVYEWEAGGEGSCATPGGCLFLVSSGHSVHPNYIFGASDSGNDVFVWTSDLLNGEDGDETASVYDARVGGGFPPPAERAGECLGEACQPTVTAPEDVTPASFTSIGVAGSGAHPRHRRHKHKRRHHNKHRRSHAGRRAGR